MGTWCLLRAPTLSKQGPPVTTTPPTVIDEIVAFNRIGADGVERYFTARTDGSDEQSLFSAEGCMCIGWSPDRQRAVDGIDERGRHCFVHDDEF